MHGIYRCEHGTVVERCRCPNDDVHLVPCPSNCPEKDAPKVKCPCGRADCPLPWSAHDWSYDESMRDEPINMKELMDLAD